MKNKKKNSNYKINFEPKKKEKKNKGKVFLITFVCIFLALVIIAGLIFGISAAIKNKKAVVKYGDVTLTEAEVKFLISYCKYDILTAYKSQGAKDTPEFWNSKCPIAKNYAELLEFKAKQLVTQVVASNYIFDKYARLSSEEKKEIKRITKEILDYRMNSSEDSFNLLAAPYGFSYSDYEGIVTKLYKFEKAYSVYYVANYEEMSRNEELCNNYYSEYSNVKLLFINTEKDYKLDSNGKRIDENGKFVYVELSDEEKAKRLEDAQKVRQAIANLGTGDSYQMNDEMFAGFVEKYPSPYGIKDQSGFYLHEDASYTTWLRNEQPMVVAEALFLEVTDDAGVYKEVKTEQGVCFIYKSPINTADMAYLDTSAESCFLDFYRGLVMNEFEKAVVEISEAVELRDAYFKIDLITHPAINHDLIPRI